METIWETLLRRTGYLLFGIVIIVYLFNIGG